MALKPEGFLITEIIPLVPAPGITRNKMNIYFLSYMVESLTGKGESDAIVYSGSF